MHSHPISTQIQQGSRRLRKEAARHDRTRPVPSHSAALNPCTRFPAITEGDLFHCDTTIRVYFFPNWSYSKPAVLAETYNTNLQLDVLANLSEGSGGTLWVGVSKSCGGRSPSFCMPRQRGSYGLQSADNVQRPFGCLKSRCAPVVACGVQ